MAGRMKRFCRKFRKDMRANMILGAMFLLAAGMAAAYFLTNDEKPLAVSAPVKIVNDGYEVMELNPLTKDLDENVTKAVQKYYERQKENSDFVETYGNLNAYMKKGKYEDTYVVFARYDMKIKDIYTAAPGVGTLYVDKDEKGRIRVNAQAEEEEVQQYIAELTSHEDVRALFQETETAYARAVQSDAMLQEALYDLQNAAQNTAADEQADSGQ